MSYVACQHRSMCPCRMPATKRSDIEWERDDVDERMELLGEGWCPKCGHGEGMHTLEERKRRARTHRQDRQRLVKYGHNDYYETGHPMPLPNAELARYGGPKDCPCGRVRGQWNFCLYCDYCQRMAHKAYKRYLKRCAKNRSYYERKEWEQKQWLKKGRETLRAIKRILRNPQEAWPSPEKASKQRRTSPT